MWNTYNWHPYVNEMFFESDSLSEVISEQIRHPFVYFARNLEYDRPSRCYLFHQRFQLDMRLICFGEAKNDDDVISMELSHP